MIPIWPRSHGLRKQDMEQQHTSSFDKYFVIHLLKGRVAELESQLKQKEAVNDFLMSALKTNFSHNLEKGLLNENHNG